jgi:Na+/proline symporter
MCMTLALAAVLALDWVGGFDALTAELDPSYFEQLGDLPFGLLMIYASTHLAALVEPTFYQRIFAARSYRAVRNAILIGILLWGAYDWVVTLLGMTARTAVLQGALDPGIAGDHSLAHLMVAVLPAGLLGLFVAGVLAAQMSTMDSYCLVAGGSLCDDLYRPLFNRRASEATLVRGTRIGILVAWCAGFAMAASFGQLLGLWVFMASFQISTTLVPILLGLYVPRWRRPLAGFLSSLLGLSSVVLANAVMVLAGAYSEARSTYVLELQLFGRHWVLIQEYIMFASVPLSLLGFFAGLLIDGRRRR